MTDVWIMPYALEADIRETIIPASGTPSTGILLPLTPGLLRWLSGKESAYQCRRCGRWGFNSWVGKISWRRKWEPAPVFLPEKSHGPRSLVGYSPWDRKESDRTRRLHFHFHGVGKYSNSILLHVNIQFSKHHLLRNLLFPHWVILQSLVKH